LVVRLPLPAEEDAPDIALNTALPAVPPAAPVPTLALATVPPIVLPPAPAPGVAPPPLLQLQNTWSTDTDLIVGDDGRLQQSAQSTEIGKCISKAVRLANSNIFFVDAFPSPQLQSQWLSQSLTAVLQDQARMDPVVHKVNARAQQDDRYMASLVSMVRYLSSSLPQLVWFLNPIR